MRGFCAEGGSCGNLWVKNLVGYAGENSCGFLEGGFLVEGTFGIVGLCGVDLPRPRGRRGGGRRRVLLELL